MVARVPAQTRRAHTMRHPRDARELRGRGGGSAEPMSRLRRTAGRAGLATRRHGARRRLRRPDRRSGGRGGLRRRRLRGPGRRRSRRLRERKGERRCRERPVRLAQRTAPGSRPAVHEGAARSRRRVGGSPVRSRPRCRRRRRRRVRRPGRRRARGRGPRAADDVCRRSRHGALRLTRRASRPAVRGHVDAGQRGGPRQRRGGRSVRRGPGDGRLRRRRARRSGRRACPARPSPHRPTPAR